ncbi:LysM peptidoglycan-binding domain-containing protein [Constantimarinum furrinae]|uniref:LysM-repeat protein n=1 Tax=Constantimarinum furrinae TaxID=2562285 RepID=A0A7G8PVF1_9FLAO|nr:LysM peptidoglycan-binding domain-containing protein [Constantimarinum furrinae]QNJ98317.1 LysM-repeat protein [Constantimarinum furrinae]
MRIVIYIAFLCWFTVGCGAVSQQEYKTHKVEKGETVYSISKKYSISSEDIYRLNPDSKNGISENTVLILPQNSVVSTAGITFKTHRVKRKETIFGIAQLYNISVDDIKKYNKELYSRQLKKGERIQIPVGNVPTTTTVVSNTVETSTSEGGIHTVMPKETKYGIARKYGITIAELEQLNPGMGENLQIGAVLSVPEDSVIDSATIEDESYEFYEVQPKEGFFRLKVKLGLSEEAIVALNPYAKDGLKAGMILKIPKKGDEEMGPSQIVNLENSIVNRKKKQIAVMLPFQLSKIDSDSLQNNAGLIRENGALRVALDFYSGVLMAAEFAKDKGISVQLDVYDTEGIESKVGRIISSNNFDDVDAVIGPLLWKNVERAVSELKRSDTPVFSPLSNREIKISSNLFQTLPSDEMLQTAMLSYLEKNSEGKNVIIISDPKHSSVKNTILSAIPNAKAISPREKGFLYATDISGKIENGGQNWIILASSDPVIVSNVVGLLNGMPQSYNLRLFTLDKNDAYDYHDVSNVHLAKLHFTFPSVSKSYDFNDKNAFLVSYKNKYDVLPNKYAVRGFDVTYDVLLRLASADDVYEASSGNIETEYIENKFRYSKKLFSGYQNQAFYIIKFNKDLNFEVVE